MSHKLNYPNGGLVITCHKEICDDIIHLAKQALSPIYVHGKTLTHQGCSRSEEEVRHRESVPETRGYVSIRVLLKRVMEAIIDVRFGDYDAYSWKPFRMDKLLSGWEKLKKDKHGQDCYYQRRDFLLFFLSVEEEVFKGP